MASPEEFLQFQNFTIQDLRHPGELEETTTRFLSSSMRNGNGLMVGPRGYTPLPVMKSFGRLRHETSHYRKHG